MANLCSSNQHNTCFSTNSAFLDKLARSDVSQMMSFTAAHDTWRRRVSMCTADET
jgi:hypothetical protein